MNLVYKSHLIKELFKKRQLDWWSLRIEKTKGLSITAWNKELRTIERGETSGLAVRVLHQGAFGFASTNNFDHLEETIKKAVDLARITSHVIKTKAGLVTTKLCQLGGPTSLGGRTSSGDDKISLKEKRDFILSLTKKTYQSDKRIKSAIISYREVVKDKIFISPDSFLEQKLPYFIISATCTAASNGQNEEQFTSLSDRNSSLNIKKFPKKIERLIKNTLAFLKADKAKGGYSTALLDGDLTSTFIHEALGHAAEADIVSAGGSCLAKLIGKKIAPDFVSVIDDPTANNFSDFGSYYFDDEGIPAQKTYLIKNGIFKTFLHNRQTSYQLKAKPTGNGRAQSFSHQPIVRMSNTFIEKGISTKKEMLSKIKNGYLLCGSRGGQVDPNKGSFQFGVARAYLVENGKIKKPIRAVSIGGSTLELLKNILVVGNKYEEGRPGFCGKDGQSVPVNGRNPFLLVKNVLIC